MNQTNKQKMTTITWNCLPLTSDEGYSIMTDAMFTGKFSKKTKKYIDTYLYDNKGNSKSTYTYGNKGEITLTQFVNRDNGWVHWTCYDNHGNLIYFEYVKVIQAIHLMKEDTSKIGTFILDDYKLGRIGTKEDREYAGKCIPDGDYDYEQESFDYIAIMDNNGVIKYYDADNEEYDEEFVLDMADEDEL